MLLKIFCRKNAMFLASLLFGLFLHPDTASAQAVYNALVAIPGIPSGAGVTVYLSGLYNFLISVVGLVAMGAIVIGGARYLTSVGNPSAIEDAKHTIYSAIYGLIIAITSWVIVTTINPDITVLKNPAMSMATGTYATSGAKYGQCALATGDPKIGCSCVDGQTVMGKTPFPPYVVSTSIAPCSASISVTLTTIEVVFSEPMDPATLVTGNFAVFPAAPGITVAPDPTRSNVAIVTFSGAIGPPPQDYSITVNVGVKNAAGTPMAALYRFAFTTGPAPYVGCTAMPIGSGCSRVCKDATLALDSKTHCLKADLRVGNGAHPIGKSLTINAGDVVYFDARSFSYDGDYKGLSLKGDPYKPADLSTNVFDNGIDRYEICLNSPCNWGLVDYACSEPILFGGCSVLFNSLGFGISAYSDWGVCGIDTIKNTGLFGLFYPYTTAGTYKATLTVTSGNDCITSATDEILITVNP